MEYTSPATLKTESIVSKTITSKYPLPISYKIPYSSKFSGSKTSVIQLLTDNTFRDSLLLQ